MKIIDDFIKNNFFAPKVQVYKFWSEEYCYANVVEATDLKTANFITFSQTTSDP